MKTLPDSLHVFEGDLYRKDTIIRRHYSGHWSTIDSTAQLKATLRAGPYTWPGCYPLFLMCSDGGPLCFKCGESQFRHIADAIKTKASDGWRVVACDVNYEDNFMYCSHCNQQIASAYGE